jgi:recombination protein RecT
MTDTTAITAPRKPSPVAILQQEVLARENEFGRALPSHVPKEKFVRTLITAITSSKDIGQCTPRSVITECMKAAADGLVIDNREATLVKFGTDAKYIPMYQGLMKMARNSGEISTIAAIIVHENDRFRYTPGLDDIPVHEIDWFGDRGAPIGAYSVVKLKDGCFIVEIMSKAQIMKIAAASKNSAQYDSGKGASWAEWWRKTVIRRISKYLPRSTDRETGDFFEAVRRDDDLYDPEAPQADAPAKPPRKKRAANGALAAAPEPKDDDIPAFLDRRGETVEDTDAGGDPRDEQEDLV